MEQKELNTSRWFSDPRWVDGLIYVIGITVLFLGIEARDHALTRPFAPWMFAGGFIFPSLHIIRRLRS